MEGDVAASAIGIPKGKVSIGRKPRETNQLSVVRNATEL